MRLPDDINKMIQDIGKKAPTTQIKYGRGAWLITHNNRRAGYVLEVDLPLAIDAGSLDQLLRMVRDYDPTKQVVVIYEIDDEWQIIRTMNIET